MVAVTSLPVAAMGSRQEKQQQSLAADAVEAPPLLIPEQHHHGRDADDADGRVRRRHGRFGESFPWLTVAAIAFLTFNTGMAIRRAGGEPWAIAFVVFSYCDLLLLFGFLRAFERADQNSPRRERIKVAVWLLTTMLTAAFSYKVAAVMPLAIAVLVWVMAFATVAGGYYAFFLASEK